MAAKEESGGVAVDGDQVVDAFHPLSETLSTTLRLLGIPYMCRPYTRRADLAHGPGVFCKNLFLKDRKGQFFLVITFENKNLDMKFLKTTVKASRNFSFGQENDLFSYLKCVPGGVTPFGLMHDDLKSVRCIIDEDLTVIDNNLNFHPYDPSKTVLITVEGLIKYVEYTGHEAEVVPLASGSC